MLLKHVYMGWKFQRTLKLDISFSLEYFFISVAIFTQVASASLIDDSSEDKKAKSAKKCVIKKKPKFENLKKMIGSNSTWE